MPSPPKNQKMLDALYGEETSKWVYSRLQELDPDFNEEVQLVAYDRYWARPGLSIRDKSMITVASLLAMERAEQTKIHMNGFLNAAGSAGDLKAMIQHSKRSIGKSKSDNGLRVLTEVLKARTKVSDKAGNFTQRDRSLVDVAVAVAAAKQPVLVKTMRKYLNEKGSREDLRHMLLHQIVYCGFPAAFSGFAALKEIEKTQK